ncbi:hypothetical protein [Tunturibacter empetritectus]|uniref:Uncharacterized protein n=1 Tax=Tunturiibacter empetritectus TaxID=3069691 RepID=A0A7W8IKR0_9BACT|nr:hypothetical protein [Edaphobacter lichenicola]MBB5318201.1 hypothetical protein [Edaphobacter lichenicola]
MFQRYRTAFGTTLGLIFLCATPVLANHVDTANATVTCNAYSFSVDASALSPGTKYEISYTIETSPYAGPAITGVIPFTASSTTTFEATVWGSFPALIGSYNFYGTASLVGHNTVPILFSPTSLSCGAPPPPPNSGKGIDTVSFNGTPIVSGDYVWFNANFSVKNIPKTGGVITFTNSRILDVETNSLFTSAAPNAQITFSPTATCSSTTFSTMTNTWITTVPLKGDDEIFLTGVAIPVPSHGVPGGINVTWSGTFNTTGAPGMSIEWKWGAAVYTSIATDSNALEVKAGHQSACGESNGDHAATPEGVNNRNQKWKNFVIGGATGGGGTNSTGSWSGTDTVTPTAVVEPGPGPKG